MAALLSIFFILIPFQTDVDISVWVLDDKLAAQTSVSFPGKSFAVIIQDCTVCCRYWTCSLLKLEL